MPESNDSHEELDDKAELFPEEPDNPVVQPTVPDSAVEPAAYGPAALPSDEHLAMEYYKQVLCFNNNAAHLLAFDQQLCHPSDFLELEDEDIDNICQAI